jgi:hypothetical protein
MKAIHYTNNITIKKHLHSIFFVMVLPSNNNYHLVIVLSSLSSPIVLKHFFIFNKNPKKNQGQFQEMTKAKDNKTLPQTKSKVYGNQREALKNPPS